ncbi:MAG: DNA helicase RecG, partial [Clostridiaceae bacterium]|nr:DNA helicase RecG [Clostridiaceae bacterium]
DQKHKVMQDFLDNEINIIVSTTVIEVGVDNPQATFMLIRNAERFGLAQLHQLRGRIGRSDLDSICILQSDTKDELALTRLRTLCKNDDGFALAEEDLRLRGPGDFFGTKQHGLPQFKLVNLYEDQELMNSVDKFFKEIIRDDPNLRKVENRNIVKAIKQRYPELLSGMIL